MEQPNADTLKALQLIRQTCQEHELHYWLDAGSMLKAIRDKSLIASSDLDLGLWHDDVAKLRGVCEELYKHGFTFRMQGKLPFSEDIIQAYFPEAWDITFSHIDFYIYANKNGEVFRRNMHKPCLHDSQSVKLYGLLSLFDGIEANASWKKSLINKLPRFVRRGINEFIAGLYKKSGSSNWLVIPAEIFSSFQTITLNDMDFQVPGETIRYLEWRYGPKWGTPDKGWRMCDGKMIRFRKISYNGISLDNMSVPDEFCVSKSAGSVGAKKKRGPFEFTPEEQDWIKSLDQ